jgi:hypothetical protein
VSRDLNDKLYNYQQMIEKSHYDLTDISFENFVQFLFAHSVATRPKEKPWYFNAEVTCQPERILGFYTGLFTKPEFLLAKFTKAELEQGFWAIPSDMLDCTVNRVIWENILPFHARELCVRSMVHLFERLFTVEHLETSAHMWWDALCFDWECGNRARHKGGEDQHMQNVMFETLTKILELQSTDCQADALHGLGHLHHPDTEEIIQKYLNSKPYITPELKKYALAAAQFQVL